MERNSGWASSCYSAFRWEIFAVEKNDTRNRRETIQDALEPMKARAG